MITDGDALDRAIGALETGLSGILDALDRADGRAILNDARDAHGLPPVSRRHFEDVQSMMRSLRVSLAACEAVAFGD